MKKIISSGKRKTSVARAILVDGSGKVLYKGKAFDSLHMFDRLKLEEPIRIAEKVLGKVAFDAELTVRGGGEKSQIDAARLALAKGIVEFYKSEKLEDIYFDYDKSLVVADIRRKEAYKPGDSKARSARQSSKR